MLAGLASVCPGPESMARCLWPDLLDSKEGSTTAPSWAPSRSAQELHLYLDTDYTVVLGMKRWGIKGLQPGISPTAAEASA